MVDARLPMILVDSDDGVAILRLLGEHDIASADELKRRSLEAVRAGKCLIVDITDTDFIDSSTLNSLIQTDAELKRVGRRLVLQYGTSSSVRRVLEISGLLDMLPHAASREDATRLARESGRGEHGGS